MSNDKETIGFDTIARCVAHCAQRQPTLVG